MNQEETAKTYLDVEDLQVYKECIRMLNGLEKSLERHLPEKERRWTVAEAAGEYGEPQELLPPGWPLPEPRTPNTEH